MRVIRTRRCEHCSAEFRRRVREPRCLWARRRFCSMPCAKDAQCLRHFKICAACKRPFMRAAARTARRWAKQIYCSQRCAARGERGTHLASESREYRIWTGMLARCEKPRDTAYFRYGARGVRVCARWHSFENFLADMGPRPSSAHSLDRIAGGTSPYAPGNVRWATRIEQNRNRSNARLITVGGETLSTAAWAERTGVRYGTLICRLNNGWAPALAVQP